MHVSDLREVVVGAGTCLRASRPLPGTSIT
jgi:hypothetical protein